MGLAPHHVRSNTEFPIVRFASEEDYDTHYLSDNVGPLTGDLSPWTIADGLPQLRRAQSAQPSSSFGRTPDLHTS
ncbi:unnamed protein product [Gadus morhua 'NCC']